MKLSLKLLIMKLSLKLLIMKLTLKWLIMNIYLKLWKNICEMFFSQMGKGRQTLCPRNAAAMQRNGYQH